MTSLAEDIARVAALRGRPAEHYDQAEAERRHAAAILTPNMLAALGQPNPDAKKDLAVYDALPPASHAFIRECPVVINSHVWRSLLDQMEESVLIERVSQIVRRLR